MSALSRAWAWFVREFVTLEGSTRLVAVMRILLVMQAWSRWGETFRLYENVEPGRFALAVLFWVSTPFLLLGWQTRLAAVAVAFCAQMSWFWIGMALGQEELAHHHTRILALGLTLLVFTPAGASFSVDRWLAVRAAAREGRPPPPERGPLWAVRAIAVTLSVMYFMAAWEKTYPGFLGGARLEQIYIAMWFGSENAPPWLTAWSIASAWGTVLLEYALAVALFVPRVRFVAFVTALCFHGFLYHQIPVGTFSCTMFALLLAYLDPDRFHAWTERQ